MSCRIWWAAARGLSAVTCAERRLVVAGREAPLRVWFFPLSGWKPKRERVGEPTGSVGNPKGRTVFVQGLDTQRGSISFLSPLGVLFHMFSLRSPGLWSFRLPFRGLTSFADSAPLVSPRIPREVASSWPNRRNHETGNSGETPVRGRESPFPQGYLKKAATTTNDSNVHAARSQAQFVVYTRQEQLTPHGSGVAVAEILFYGDPLFKQT